MVGMVHIVGNVHQSSNAKLALVFVAAFAIGCSETRIDAQRPKVDESITLLSGARDVHRNQDYDGVLEYEVSAEYPAQFAIDSFDRRFSQSGWESRRQEAVFNPDKAINTGVWAVVEMGGKRRFVWTGEWRDTSGTIVAVNLRFDAVQSDKETTPVGPMHVTVTTYSARTIELLQRSMK